MKQKSMLARLLAVLMMVTGLAAPALAADAQQDLVCLGGDLTDAQRDTVWNLLGMDRNAVKVVEVHIEDEKALLGKYVPAEKIGSRSLSSVGIHMTGSGSGISVSTHNITWVTAEMYSSAMATAGITDAQVTVVAPVGVSGTAALAGIFKAYETAANSTLSEQAKDVASEELVSTGELGEAIGKDEAAELIAMIKQKVVEAGLDDPEKIRTVIEEAAQQLGITLTEEQIQMLIDLMLKIGQLNIDPEQFSNALNSLYNGWKQLESKGLFEALKELINRFFNWIGSLFS